MWEGCLLLLNITAFSLEEGLKQASQGHQVRSKIEEDCKKGKEAESFQQYLIAVHSGELKWGSKQSHELAI